ncbi:hypothetical protein Moror_5457 [Moniliophthora roreri MCA 2997]|uniref:Uncharacterized protein n=1 Tax=Moniliophthora roreri (strain MCA 2997) TaxID=1381753 RepID=V2WNB1_MONRO|nr:hypothetical protein Moror_5457 [Moniliophthora roreri MCA 2997]
MSSSHHQSWPRASKLALLLRYWDLFLENLAEMYWQATKEFMETWGYNLPLEQEPVYGINYSLPNIETFPAGAAREAKLACHQGFVAKLKQIMNWATYNFHHAV